VNANAFGCCHVLNAFKEATKDPNTAFTVLPPIYMALFLFYVFSSVMRQPSKNDPMFVHFELFFIIHGLVILVMTNYFRLNQ